MTIDELSILSRDEMLYYICHLEEKIEKQSRKIFGLEQQVRNFKEKEEKRYDHEVGKCNLDTDYVNKYHNKTDK